MKQLDRRLTLLEAMHSAAGDCPDNIILSGVWRDDNGDLQSRPQLFMILGDPVQYMVADYDAWPDDVKARYDGR